MSLVRRNERANPLLIAGLLGVAGAIFGWFMYSSDSDSKVMRAQYALRVIRTGLDNYAAEHEGAYPPTERVTVNRKTDVLLKGGYLQSYPTNPYVWGKQMKNRPTFSPGDFRYERSQKKPIYFTLEAYGRRKSSGQERNGVVASMGRE